MEVSVEKLTRQQINKQAEEYKIISKFGKQKFKQNESESIAKKFYTKKSDCRCRSGIARSVQSTGHDEKIENEAWPCNLSMG